MPVALAFGFDRGEVDGTMVRKKMRSDPGGRTTFWLMCLLASTWLLGCSSAAPSRLPSSPPSRTGPAVRVVLVSGEGSKACCGIVTVNPGDHPARVTCHLLVFDPEGRLVYAGIVPVLKTGQRRSPLAGGTTGFTASPGRESHGRIDLPIDLDRSTYRATCRTPSWHGAPPI